MDIHDGIHIYNAHNITVNKNSLSKHTFGIICDLIYSNTISNNTIIGNDQANGIYLADSKNNKFFRNTISNNLVGLKLMKSQDNKIEENNFIGNKLVNAGFSYLNLENKWNKNYWDNWVGFGPKFIFEDLYLIPTKDPFYCIPIPGINIDWHTATELYDIPTC